MTFDRAPASCPICGEAVVEAVDFCPSCRVGLSMDEAGRFEARAPDVRRGESIVAWDFRADPPPECARRTVRWPQRDGSYDTLTAHPEGVIYESGHPTVMTFREQLIRIRDGCVRLNFFPLSLAYRVGIAARYDFVGQGAICYVLDLSLPAKTLFVARLVSTPGTSSQEVLQSCAIEDVIARGSAIEALELRMSGGWLLGYVNEQLALRIYDPAYGIGSVGFRVGGEPGAGAARVLLKSASINAVSP